MQSLTASVCTPPSLRRVPVQVSAASAVAPIDIGWLAWKAGPGHAALVPVDADVPVLKTHFSSVGATGLESER